jgi:hypothetical protein
MDQNIKAVQGLRGLVRGDSMNWAAARQRLNLVPPKRRMRMRYLDSFAEERSQSTLPVPYLHSTHESVLDPLGPADVTEWFTASLLSAARMNLSLETAGKHELWKDLVATRALNPAEVRGRVGTTIALETLANRGFDGTSGKDNPHYFDDLALVRAVAVAFCCGNKSELSEKIIEEVGLTASGDGLSGAVAFGHLFFDILTGTSVDEALDSLVAGLAEDTWPRGVLEQALNLVPEANSVDELAFALERDIADHVYSYQVSVPETLAMVCAHLKFAGSRDQLIAAGILHSSRAEVMAPLIWSLAGLIFGGFPDKARDLQGLSIKAVKGINPEHILGDITTRIGTEIS